MQDQIEEEKGNVPPKGQEEEEQEKNTVDEKAESDAT